MGNIWNGFTGCEVSNWLPEAVGHVMDHGLVACFQKLIG